MSDIGRFKKDKQTLNTKKINNVIGLYEEGYLQAMIDYENLIMQLIINKNITSIDLRNEYIKLFNIKDKIYNIVNNKGYVIWLEHKFLEK